MSQTRTFFVASQSQKSPDLARKVASFATPSQSMVLRSNEWWIRVAEERQEKLLLPTYRQVHLFNMKILQFLCRLKSRIKINTVLFLFLVFLKFSGGDISLLSSPCVRHWFMANHIVQKIFLALGNSPEKAEGFILLCLECRLRLL